MVEGDVPHTSWPSHPLAKLVSMCEAAKDEKKYLFIWDQQGSVGTFMQYKGHLAPLGPEVIKKALGTQSA